MFIDTIEILPKNQQVVIMDDDNKERRAISSSLRKYGFEAIHVDNGQEAIRLAQRTRARLFILDIHMGRDRDQEGLTALEKIKSINPDFFVGILSGYPNRFKEMALRLNANVFMEKSANPEIDTLRIIRKALIDNLAITQSNLQIIDNVLGTANTFNPEDEQEEDDENYLALQKLKLNERWLKQNNGNYVAFISGRFILSNPNKEILLSFMREKHPGRGFYFCRLDDYCDDIIDLPTPFLNE